MDNMDNIVDKLLVVDKILVEHNKLVPNIDTDTHNMADDKHRNYKKETL
jgi:hypothetical protein